MIETTRPAAAGPQFLARRDGFSPERQARFLAALAHSGNVRVAAGQAGISPQAAYLARRRAGTFAAAWDAALVLARDAAEQLLADRALNGVDEPVFYRGECVAVRRRYDARLLLAHLARLDARSAADGAAARRAERFDELLALIAGAPVPVALMPQAGGAQPARGARPRETDPLLPPSRAAHVAASGEGLGPRAYARARARAEAEWDAWAAAAQARVDALIGAAPDGAGPDRNGPNANAHANADAMPGGQGPDWAAMEFKSRSAPPKRRPPAPAATAPATTPWTESTVSTSSRSGTGTGPASPASDHAQPARHTRHRPSNSARPPATRSG